jgi:hypothetical protein
VNVQDRSAQGLLNSPLTVLDEHDLKTQAIPHKVIKRERKKVILVCLLDIWGTHHEEFSTFLFPGIINQNVHKPVKIILHNSTEHSISETFFL